MSARGDVMPWIDLFLMAVETQARDAVTRAQRIVELRETYRQAATSISSAFGPALVDLICENPVVTTRAVERKLGVSRPTSLRLLRQMERLGVLAQDAAGARGQRRYVARELMAAVQAEQAGAPTIDEVLHRADGRAGGSVPFDAAADILRDERTRR